MFRFPARIALFVTVLMLALAAWGQTPADATSEEAVGDLLKETQTAIHANNYTGLVWWIPVEFWEQSMRQEGSSTQKVADTVKPLRDYVMVAVVVGKVGSLGSIGFVPAEQLRGKTFLRDAKGADYPPVAKVAPDAALLASIVKPILANATGKVGENMEILFFPARNAAGQTLADPHTKGSFSIVLKEVLGKPETAYEWQLPLTALSPPKYCPIGKERVNANWNYCPWHGVPLNEPAKPVATTPPSARQ